MTDTVSQANVKNLKSVSHDAWTLAPYLFGIDAAFANVIIPAFTTAAVAGLFSRPLYKTWLLANLVTFFVALFLTINWMLPALKFIKTEDTSLRDEVRRKFSHVYPSLAKLIGILVISRLAALLVLEPQVFSPAIFFSVILPVFALITFVQYSFALLLIDNNLAKADKAMALLYEERELYQMRSGASISLFVKMSMLISSCAIVPFIIIVVAETRHTADSQMFWLLWMCATTLFAGMAYLLRGVQRPINSLLAKMARVAEGDYNVKSRIYYTDEVAHLKAGFNSMVDGLREREALRETFGRHVSIEIARELLKGKKVNLGGEEVEAAVMFCDIRSFTPLSERLSPPELVEFLNAYFAAITPAIAQQRGVINKFIGDAVMAVYTPQLGSEDYAADAVRSALGMRRALAEFNASIGGENKVCFGIGIHAGSLVAGNVGTAARLEYTFIGDTVNIASRVESKTKDFNTDILVTKNVMDMCGGKIAGAEFESVGAVPLKGKAEPLELYKVL